MNKNVLTLLGCSGSLALMLATASIAMADGTTDNATASDSGAVDITFSAPSKAIPTAAAQTSVQPQYANVDAASGHDRRFGDRQISL